VVPRIVTGPAGSANITRPSRGESSVSAPRLPGRVDHHARAHRDLGAAHAVVQRGPHAGAVRAGGEGQRPHLHVRGDHRPGLVRGAGGGQRQPCVVGGRVPVRRAAAQPLGAQRRLERAHGGVVERAVRADVAEQRQRVVEREAGRQLPARHARAGVHRPGEAQRAHEVRRRAQQRAPLAAGLEDQGQVPVLQVAHPAVHQPRRAARRAAPEVVGLHQRHPQPTPRRVARDPRAGDPAADHQQVVHAVGQRLERARARGRVPGRAALGGRPDGRGGGGRRHRGRAEARGPDDGAAVQDAAAQVPGRARHGPKHAARQEPAAALATPLPHPCGS
jgi:hypothetical protein